MEVFHSITTKGALTNLEQIASVEGTDRSSRTDIERGDQLLGDLTIVKIELSKSPLIRNFRSRLAC